VGDGIEDFTAKGQSISGGLHEPAPIRQPVVERSLLRDPKTLSRSISKHDCTPCGGGEMKTWPTASGTEVQQRDHRAELQSLSQLGSLGDRRVAGCSVI
jgi:hypothetical protein